MVRLKDPVTPALVMEGKTLLRQVSCNLIEYLKIIQFVNFLFHYRHEVLY